MIVNEWTSLNCNDYDWNTILMGMHPIKRDFYVCKFYEEKLFSSGDIENFPRHANPLTCARKKVCSFAYRNLYSDLSRCLRQRSHKHVLPKWIKTFWATNFPNNATKRETIVWKCYREIWFLLFGFAFLK